MRESRGVLDGTDWRVRCGKCFMVMRSGLVLLGRCGLGTMIVEPSWIRE